MNTSVTLTAEEFSKIHNALCFANSKGIEETVATIREALAGAYQQEEADFDSKMDYFRAYQEGHDFAAIWSMYELPVHCFLQEHPFPSDAFVVYGKGHVPVMGPTWGDVYRAADCAIRNSGDFHHIFIEGFAVKNGNELHMSTGS